MSGFIRNELTLYLRPQSAIPPYRVYQCAIWLVKNRKFANVRDAHAWLLNMEYDNKALYKAVMSAYFHATDYEQWEEPRNDVNNYRSTQSNYYGEEPHMWF